MTPKQQAFIAEYLIDFNATQAAIRAGYSERGSRVTGHRLLTNPNISEEIERLVSERTMGADEVLLRLGKQARFDPSPYIEGYGRRTVVRTDKMIEDGFGDLIREIWQTAEGVRVKIADPDWALEKIGKAHGLFVDRSKVEHSGQVETITRITENRNGSSSDS